MRTQTRFSMMVFIRWANITLTWFSIFTHTRWTALLDSFYNLDFGISPFTSFRGRATIAINLALLSHWWDISGCLDTLCLDHLDFELLLLTNGSILNQRGTWLRISFEEWYIRVWLRLHCPRTLCESISCLQRLTSLRSLCG